MISSSPASSRENYVYIPTNELKFIFLALCLAIKGNFTFVHSKSSSKPCSSKHNGHALMIEIGIVYLCASILYHFLIKVLLDRRINLFLNNINFQSSSLHQNNHMKTQWSRHTQKNKIGVLHSVAHIMVRPISINLSLNIFTHIVQIPTN